MIFAIFDNVGRLTHQSVGPYSVTFVSANPSFRSANCPYLSVCPVHFGVAVDPPIGSIGPSINLYPSIPCHPNSMRACVRAYLSNLSANLSHLSPRAFSHIHSFFPILPLTLSIYLSINPFAIVRLLLLRAPTWILHAASIDLQNDLSRARSIRSPLPRVPRGSRGFPETQFSSADVARSRRGRDSEGVSRAPAANDTLPLRSGGCRWTLTWRG